MAVRRRTSRVSGSVAYNTYGSVAYAPAYDGSAVRAPRREEELYRPEPQRRQRERVRHHALERAKVKVREAGQVAPFAVVSFAAVAVFAVMLLLSCAQYLAVTNEVVSLRREMSSLESQNVTLSAEYERLYDISSIQEAVGSEMVKPTGDQVVYIDLSEPDTVTVFGAEEGEGSLLEEIGERISGLIEYFR